MRTRRPTSEIGVVLLIGVVFACGGSEPIGGPNPDPSPPTEPVSDVSGVVRDFETGGAISGATVHIDGVSTTTGADGAFELSDLSPGPVHLTASAPNFEPYEVDLSLTQGANAHDVRLLFLRASLVGTVTRQDDGSPLAGASVRAGTAVVTTGEDGAYELTNLRSGPTDLIVAAEGFDPYEANVTLDPGDNIRGVTLGTQTVFYSESFFGDYAIYLPRDVDAFRGVFLYVAGSAFDQRYIATGKVEPGRGLAAWWTDLWYGPVRDLAREHGLAVMGIDPVERTPAAYDDVFETIGRFASMSGHGELAGAALIPFGYSWGGCFVNQLTARHPTRVLAFHTVRPSCWVSPAGAGWDAGAAKAAPGLFVPAEDDDVLNPFVNGEIVESFVENRAAGAHWALAVEPTGGHDFFQPVTDHWIVWIESMIQRRLAGVAPSATPISLNSVDEATGWLGTLSGDEVAAFSDYSGDPLDAAWLPSAESAALWQVLVTGGN